MGSAGADAGWGRVSAMRRPDQMTRAGDYVLGLMDDVERERAERDLEIDPAFREAVIGIAERMRLLDPAGQARDGDAGDDAAAWRVISARIAEMPQMRAARPVAVEETNPEGMEASRATRLPVGFDADARPHRRGALLVVCLVVCGLVYAAGVVTARFW